jgi:putative SOS response-associated peptidase YedK
MCGRFSLRADPRAIADEFDVAEIPELPRRYNIAPATPIASIRVDPRTAKRELIFVNWGLVPSWADDPKIGARMINARAETIDQKNSFKHPFKRKRCLVIADGFYEWRSTGEGKRPFFIHRQDDRPFAFAAIWDHWGRDGGEFESASIITTEPNELMKPIHDRMPVILAREDYAEWLDPNENDIVSLKTLLRACSPEGWEAYPVDPVVNNPRNDVEACIARVA